jgi:protein SCO1/2
MNNKRLFLKAFGGTALTPAFIPASASARMSRTPDGGRPDNHYFPNVELQTHEGKKVRFYDDLVKGKLVVFNMMYTLCTGICPVNTASLLSVQKAFGARVGKDIFMYSLTLQPELATPDALREYTKKYDVRPGWTYLTGKRPDMELVRRKLGFYDSNPIADADINHHTGVLRIGDGTRNKWMMTSAVTPTRQIVKAITNL